MRRKLARIFEGPSVLWTGALSFWGAFPGWLAGAKYRDLPPSAAAAALGTEPGESPRSRGPRRCRPRARLPRHHPADALENGRALESRTLRSSDWTADQSREQTIAVSTRSLRERSGSTLDRSPSPLLGSSIGKETFVSFPFVWKCARCLAQCGATFGGAEYGPGGIPRSNLPSLAGRKRQGYSVPPQKNQNKNPKSQSSTHYANRHKKCSGPLHQM